MEEKIYIVGELLFIAIVSLILMILALIIINVGPPSAPLGTTIPVVPIRDRNASLPAISRLKREYNLLKEGQNHDTSIHASPIDENNMLLWKAEIVGPQDTPYENGLFNLIIEFSSDYPCAPPSESRVVFISKMFHPNVCDTGSKMVLKERFDSKPEHTTWSILEDPPKLKSKIKRGEVLLGNDMWGPGYEIYFILKAIQTLLGSPNVVDKKAILNPEAAKLFIENYEEYENRVFECVEESWSEDKTTDIQQYLEAQTEETYYIDEWQPKNYYI